MTKIRLIPIKEIQEKERTGKISLKKKSTSFWRAEDVKEDSQIEIIDCI